jgi:hypothetical protein
MTYDHRRVPLEFPLSTGQVAAVLGITEPRLSEAVRRGRVSPGPQICAGRRLWFSEHLIRAAESLGLLDDDLLLRAGEARNDA